MFILINLVCALTTDQSHNFGISGRYYNQLSCPVRVHTYYCNNYLYFQDLNNQHKILRGPYSCYSLCYSCLCSTTCDGQNNGAPFLQRHPCPNSQNLRLCFSKKTLHMRSGLRTFKMRTLSWIIQMDPS